MNEMNEEIVEYTNGFIHLVLHQFTNAIEATSRNAYFRLIDQIDIKAFLGILYLRAALGLNLRITRNIWTHESSNDVSAATVSWNRFHFPCKFITFDKKSTRNDRWKNYMFACMREQLEMMSKQNFKR